MDVNFSVPRQTLRLEVVKLNNCTKQLLCSANIEDKNRSWDNKAVLLKLISSIRNLLKNLRKIILDSIFNLLINVKTNSFFYNVDLKTKFLVIQ